MTEKFIKEYDKDLYLFEQKEYCKELAFEIINKLTCSIGNDDFRTEREVLHNILMQEQKWCNEQSKRIGGPYIDLSQIKLKFCECWVYRYNNAKEEYKTKIVNDFLRAFHKEYFEKVFYTLPTNTLLTTEILQAIRVIAYNRNKKRVVGGLINGKIKIWDAKTGKCLNVIQGHKSSITTITFSPDGKYIASSSKDRTIKIWNAKSGECIKTLKGHTWDVLCVAWSPNGEIIASCSADETIKIWNAKTGDCLQTLKGHSGNINSVSFSYDNVHLISTSDDETIKIWELKKGNCLQTLKGHEDFSIFASFNPNGEEIISTSFDQTIRVWKVNE